MIEKLFFYLNYPFVRYAIIVGIMISLSASLLGVTLVLKRYSYIGDGLSHVAFGAIAVASVLKIADATLFITPITIAVAILILKIGQNAKIHSDAVIAMISVGSLAIGYMLMNIFNTNANISADVCTTLFGSTSILTLTKFEVIVCIILSLVVILVYLLFYNKIFAITFDENFATASGVRSGNYNLLIAVLIAVVIVLGMNLVGSLLISALVIFPAISSMRVFGNFKAVVISSALISLFCALFGIIISILASTPVGSTIVSVNIFVFVLFYIIGRCCR